MNIGSLYTVKKYFWLLSPTKEILEGQPVAYTIYTIEALVRHNAACYSTHYNCEVTYFSPDSIVVFLEEEGKYKKVLTSDGKIGWIWFGEAYNDCFEEVKSE